MKTKLHLLLFLLALTIVACGGENDPSQIETSTSVDTKTQVNRAQIDESVKIVNVKTKEMKLEEFTNFVRLIGEVKAKDDIVLSSESAGVIVAFYAEEGDVLKKGDNIAKIDDQLLKKDIVRVKAATSLAYENYTRTKKIWEEDSIGSELTYLNAKYSYEQQQAVLNQLEIQLSKTTIKSPINGVLESKFAMAGELLQPGSQVARIIGTDNIKVQVGVPANYTGKIAKNDSIIITFDAYPGEIFSAVVSRIGSSIETQSRMFQLEALIPNFGNKLKINMIANVTIEIEQFENALIVEQQYVMRTENGYQLFLAGKGEKGHDVAVARMVSLGPSFNNRVVITDGLEAGDTIITLGAAQVENMTRIQVINENSSSIATH